MRSSYQLSKRLGMIQPIFSQFFVKRLPINGEAGIMCFENDYNNEVKINVIRQY